MGFRRLQETKSYLCGHLLGDFVEPLCYNYIDSTNQRRQWQNGAKLGGCDGPQA